MDFYSLDPVIAGLTLAFLAGLSVPLGATLARFERIHPDWLETELRHSVVAFGGGALLSAVALVLIPEAVERGTPQLVLGCFLGGGLVFFAVDRMLAAIGGRVAQFLAMMLDYLPEAMALGALITADPGVALVTAGLIAVQNLPEGFGAWREMAADSHLPRRRLVLLFAMVAPLGPVAAAVGLFLLADQPAILAAVMAFASGGIVYLLFQDIAPQAHLDKAYAPALGSVMGFALGLAGHMAMT
ncbi:ZIP family metal transporter [Roseicyclus marinus]|uniref:ZIP family metal transporter n=1 Tax=Roseicyclus marinus TaxID=2161673 RepID=UPI00240EC59D|nr:divalent cation transporter [Roseicyclus marinus]MDG3040827.1 divalent cation transporter [Roseicyclus marinus]